MTPPPLPQTPRLPSLRVGAILAAGMLAVGIALGALIGAGPASSLASSSRAAALGHVLALLALSEETNSGSDLLLSSEAAHPPASTPQPTPSSSSEASTGGGEASGNAGSSTPTYQHAASTPSPSSRSVSPTPATTPAGAGEGESESEKAPTTGKPLPPIADAWLIELPYGTSFESALKQSAAAPYLDAQLKREGTVLSGYTSLAAGQLAGAATLLSGQVGASVTTLAPPACVADTQTNAPAGQPAPTGQVTTAGQAAPTGQVTPAGQAATGTPCPSGEPAGIQAANAFLQEVVPTITASPAYREHGLIVITFSGVQSATTYPAGTLTSTLTATGTPAGALLLSPFLRHPGTQSASAFNPLAPRESLAGLLVEQHH